MVLNNFAKTVAGGIYTGSGNSVTYINESGNSWTYGYSFIEALRTPRARNSYGGSADQGVTVVLGAGDTAATPNDYALSNDITTNLTYLSGIASPAGDGVITSITQTYQNSTGAAVTIKEIGLLVGVGYNWQSGGFILMTRKVLDAPVTIPDGKTYSFNITIALNN